MSDFKVGDEVCADVSRVEIIDHRSGGDGRVYVLPPGQHRVEFSIQDDGRTLKIFVSDVVS